MEKLLFTLGIIASGLALGYLIQLVDRGGVMTLPLSIAVLRKTLQKIGLLFFMPISFLGAVWVVSFGDMRVAFLPLVGVCALTVGGILGLLLSKLLKQSAKQTGVLFCCGSFTNIGAIGGLVCYMFLGEAGFALIALYKMFEEIVYYTIGFPIARFYSGETGERRSFARRILGVVTDPFVAAALSAFCIGLSLNLLNVARPPFFETVTAVSIPVGTFIIIVSIGLGMRFSQVGKYLPVSIGICVIKFMLVPIIACTLAYLFDLHLVADGLPFKVVLVLSSMPVAFNALVASSIYDLDLDMANSCWLISTGSLVVVMPWLYFLLSTSFSF
ncbi:MAG: putative permease [Desulforhopalus sp.]|jgi:predicted permease